MSLSPNLGIEMQMLVIFIRYDPYLGVDPGFLKEDDSQADMTNVQSQKSAE